MHPGSKVNQNLQTVKQEKCTACGRGRSETPFPPKGGTCKECLHEKQARYREEHREEHRDYDRRRYKEKGDEIRARVKQYAQANPEKVSTTKKVCRKKKPERVLAANLKKYNLTIVGYNALLLAQDGCCAICRKPPEKHRLSVDHDHETGRVRGLLCGNCNAMLGHAHDNVQTLELAIKYLVR